MSDHNPAALARLCGAAVFLAGAVATASHGSILSISSDGPNSASGIGSFTGSIEYFAIAPNSGVLTITLTNTTTASFGGYITGFVFNVDSTDVNATASLTSWTHPFVGVTNHTAPPFGQSFMAGAALGGHWAGGGSPNNGIAVGQTGTFEFSVSASDAMALSAASFIDGPDAFNFVVRFRGFENGDSDKVPAFVAIPAPAAMGLFALAGFIGRTRRRT